MTAEDFNRHYGFTVEIEPMGGQFNHVHVIDSGKRIFKTGVRKGKSYVRTALLESHISKTHKKLMDLILEKLFH